MKPKLNRQIVICYEFDRDTTPINSQIAKIKEWCSIFVHWGKLNISFALGSSSKYDKGSIAEFSVFVNDTQIQKTIEYFDSVISYEFKYYIINVELKTRNYANL